MTDTPPPTLQPPLNGVTVRMYRVGGLGDCFLLAFRTRMRRTRYMLIDCGIFLGTKDGSKRMRQIAEDIKAATGNRIHTLVATHEHWDHLSGFQYARPTFDEMQIDEAWLAWTECPGHPLADQMRKRREFTLRALHAALTQLRAMRSPLAARIEGVLSFHDFLSADTKLTGSAGLMKYVQQIAKNTRYLRPTEPPLTWPDVPGVRIFVLGPPEDEKLLTRSDPSGMEGEVYERPESLNSAAAFYASVLSAADPENLASSEKDIFERSLPFDKVHGIRIQDAGKHAEFGDFFQHSYGFSDAQGNQEDQPADPQAGQGTDQQPDPQVDPQAGQGASQPASEQGPEWRRIDMDWWGQVENLALHLDNDTNNTSLALAIELPGGKVLLFPGDAQVGNWHSWHSLSWPEEKGEPVTAGQLLQRTVLYKVGHHGSHNATLRDKGLELMTRPDLVAMIPVYKQAAEQRKWAMPFPALLERLKEKTRGRILYSDPHLPPQEEVLTPEAWDVASCCVNQDPGEDNLWVELVIETRQSAEEKPPILETAPVGGTKAGSSQPAAKPRPRPAARKHTPE